MIFAATPAIARAIVAGPFNNRGQCHSWLPWSKDDAKKGWGQVFQSDLRKMTCQQMNGRWYIFYE